MELTDLNYTFTFGKYKGRKIKDIFDNEGVDVSYLFWCINNVPSFSNTISKKFKEAIKERYQRPSSSFNSGDLFTSENAYFNDIYLDSDIH
jgi:hypothetical protein